MAFKYTKEILVPLVATSTTYSQVIRGLGLKPSGGNHRTVCHYIRLHQIDTAHFLGFAHQKGIPSTYMREKIPSEHVLIENSRYNSAAARRIIIREKLLPYECLECKIHSWRGVKLSLQLDHINGDNNDHRIENLRWLCPNCHAITPTYGGKNIRIPPKEKPKCGICGKNVSRGAARCHKCELQHRPRSNKIEWPDMDILLSRVAESSYLQVSRELGVSDNAIRRHIQTAQRT